MSGNPAVATPDDGFDRQRLWEKQPDKILAFLIKRQCPINELAFGAIYGRYADQLQRFIYSRLHAKGAYSVEDAHDIFQDVWIIALEKLPNDFVWNDKANTDNPLSSWLYTTTENKIREHLRRRSKVIPHAELPERLLHKLDRDEKSGDPAAEPEPELTSQEVSYLHRIADALKLSRDDRQILWLRYFRNLSFTEIGRELNKGAGTVRVRHHRLLQRIRSHSDKE